LGSELPVLFVSYIFPPVGEVGAKRIERFCRYLPDFGIRPVVLTVQPEYYRYPDPSYHPPEHLQIVRTAMRRMPLDWYRKWRTTTAAASSGSSVTPAPHETKKTPGLLRRNLLALLQSPDPYWGWHGPAVRAGTELIRSEGVRLMISSGPPWISHLVAHSLAAKSGVPWFADFRDPWAFDPHVEEDEPGWKLAWRNRMESRCIGAADRVLFTTERIRRLYLQRYPNAPAEKFVTLMNGFEDAAPRAATPRPDRKKLLLHIGSLYARRRVDTFCQAVQLLIQQGRVEPGSLEVLFLGDADPVLRAEAERSAPELFRDATVRFAPRVPWQQAQDLMWSADVLLLFQGSLRLEIPAKLFEYMPTGKPMFAVVEAGALSDVIDDSGAGHWADPARPQEIAEKLLRTLEMQPRAPELAVRALEDRYHCRKLNRQLARWIEERAAAPRPDASRPRHS
jgi:glycosyltransferase involved in cell wall biosynthesis